MCIRDRFSGDGAGIMARLLKRYGAEMCIRDSGYDCADGMLCQREEVIKEKERGLHHKMMQLVWIDIIIFFLIAGAGVILSQRIYRQDMETELSLIHI